MSEDQERTLGKLLATVESLKVRMARLEGLAVKLGTGATAVIIAYLLKQNGLF